MKIEISIDKEGEEKEDEMQPELMDEQKVALGKKLQKNISLTRMERKMLADYLLNAKNNEGRPLDPVARFHLDNGASVEHIRWLGDVSAKGLRNNAGFMVNYLYDLDHVVTNHEAHVKHGTIIASRHVRAVAQDGH